VQADANIKRRSRINIPNVLCAIRLAGCPVLLYLAAIDAVTPFLYLFFFLVVTDWIDGKIARLLDQRSAFGARLDSIADAAVYGCLFLAAIRLRPDALQQEWVWIVVALVTYLVAGAAAVIKFRRWPAYHTRAAKVCWFLNAVAAFCLFADVAVWPLRIAMACVTLANLESIAITLTIDEWRTDVRSIVTVWSSSVSGRGVSRSRP
jgi:CDP-diacylglycerol--glycerol-3-phosphate 3-phosphatidyltransferase